MKKTAKSAVTQETNKDMIVWLIYTGILIYMEIVFHLGNFGLQKGSPIFLLSLIALVAALQVLIEGCFDAKGRSVASRIMLWGEFVIFAVQAVYYHIFCQPLQIMAIIFGGEDALTNYWREALAGLFQTLPLIVLMALPLITLEILKKQRKWHPGALSFQGKIYIELLAVGALICCTGTIAVGSIAKADYAEDYQEYYDPESVMRNMGVLTMVQRDSSYEIQTFLEDMYSNSEICQPQKGETAQFAEQTAEGPEEEPADEQAADQPDEETDEMPVEEMKEPDTSPNVMQMDYEKLAELSQDNKETKWLAEYIAGEEPTDRNEYTGIFQGYNLIYLTAEGFSTYAVREDLTPTLYRMLHSSFVFDNYYVPLWQTSTSDGEYVNCTGLIPDRQFSMRKSASNNMAFSLPRFFAREGVYSRAYHNNSLTYYDRYLSHPNLGYDFKAIKLGGLSRQEWGDQLFVVEHPDAWPASDYEMMMSTMEEYVDEDRFHVYYMTVSGHMNYDFAGNRMSSWNKDAVADLAMSETARAYLACNIELDKAMAYLLERLEQAGKLENTVICLSADHYPYAMMQEEYEELAGKDLSQERDLYRNSLILWNAGMEEPVIVEKPCCSVDILPTLLNLFGFEYDSRFYAGRDIFSTTPGLVIFNDKSFVTDTVIYDRKSKKTTWKRELSEQDRTDYLDRIKEEVNDRYQFSSYVLRNDYYDILDQCIIE